MTAAPPPINPRHFLTVLALMAAALLVAGYTLATFGGIQ